MKKVLALALLAWHALAEALARAEAGLPPSDVGSLGGTLERAVGAFTAAEATWLALLGVLVFAAALLFEALAEFVNADLAVLPEHGSGPPLRRAFPPCRRRLQPPAPSAKQ